MNTITVGIIGAGRGTELHCMGYSKVSGLQVRLKSIYDQIHEKALQAKQKYGIEQAATSLDSLLLDNEIDVKELVVQALKHGKHVICEKPLCGFFGAGTMDKQLMYDSVLRDLEELDYAIDHSGKTFMYAENFIYAPAITKAAEIIRAKDSKILYAKGEESLAGSSSPVAGYWEKSGGGTLMRVGSHPLGAIIWLKESLQSAHVSSVIADISAVTPSLSDYEHRHIQSKPVDVEDTATVCLTFSDNTKATVIACDTRLGGSLNYVDLYCNDTTLECRLTMNNTMSTYLLDEDGLNNVELSEMLRTKTGWNNPFISDEILRGYVAEMQDFMESIAFNHSPKSNYQVAKETTKVMYAAYLSAQKGQTIFIDNCNTPQNSDH